MDYLFRKTVITHNISSLVSKVYVKCVCNVRKHSKVKHSYFQQIILNHLIRLKYAFYFAQMNKSIYVLFTTEVSTQSFKIVKKF